MFYLLIYRSPNQSTNVKCSEMTIGKIKKENTALIILTGDFNARSFQFYSEESAENPAGKRLADLSNDYNLVQIIDEATHLPRDNIETCIDLILTDNRHAFINSGVIPSPDPKCKHQIIFGKVDFHIPSPPKYTLKVRNYNRNNFQGITNDIKHINWQDRFCNRTVNDYNFDKYA